MVAIKRSSVPKEGHETATVAKLLVLGAKQVGKSAAIVRYTTGRYIHEYSEATSSWLYRHSLSESSRKWDASSPTVDYVEMLEQRDVQVLRDWTTIQENSNATSVTMLDNQSLSDRVAQDQQLDQRRAEKQDILDKLLWANAYIVIYAINDSSTFNKAIKYLNLIDNNINSSQNTPKPLLSTSGAESIAPSGCATSSSLGASSHGCTSSSSNGSITDDLSTVGRNLFGMPNSHHRGPQPMTSASTSGGTSGCGCSANQGHPRRPILLLANKCDLEKSQRQVSTSDGRMLAIRHQSMFAEVSVADTHKLLESCLTNLIEQIEPACLHTCQFSGRRGSSPTTITQWQPPAGTQFPICASLVKCAPLAGIVIQSRSTVVQSRVERANPQLVASLKKSQQPRHSSSSEPAKSHRENSYLDRYESLKSSFKTKASMARNFTVRHNNVKQVSTGTQKSSSGDIKIHRAEFCEPITGRNKTTSWLRSHIGGSSSSAAQSGMKQATEGLSQDGKRVGEFPRHKRPLFRYKNRHKTVAFETQEMAPTSGELKHSNRTAYTSPSGVSGDADLSRTSDYSASGASLASGNDPSTHSYIDGHSFQLNSDHSSPEEPAKNIQPPAHSNGETGNQLSGEFCPLDTNQQPQTSTKQCDRLASGQRPGNVGKKRYQLVKSVQATLNNLTRSSNPTQTQTQTVVVSSTGAKRSFCNSLFGYSGSQTAVSEPIAVKKISQPSMNLAKVEYIRRESTTARPPIYPLPLE